MNTFSTNTQQHLYAFLLYTSTIIVGFALCFYFSSPKMIDENQLLHFDAQHYFDIKNIGYEGFRIAFFPLFPLLWKYLSLTVFGIIFFNFSMFIISFFALIKTLRIYSLNLILLMLSVPSFMFFYLPYSDALFFCTSTLILIGLHKNILHLVLLGLFLSSLSRPSVSILLPALFIVEFFSSSSIKTKLIKSLAYSLTSLFGLFLVGWIQYLDTNEWFKFFEIQKLWGNTLQVPKLPLRSWGGGFMAKIDGIALLIGSISGFILIFYIKKYVTNRIAVPKVLIFSLAYLGGMTLAVLLFRGGSLFSLNRFLFCSPCILVLLYYFQKSTYLIDYKKIMIHFLMLSLFWLLFHSYIHIIVFIQYGLASIYVLLLLSLKHCALKTYSIWLLIIINFGFQFLLFSRFINKFWVA
ncbi:MAG: hypothetical protein ACPG4W_05190 [Flavobacteriales bacterium]